MANLNSLFTGIQANPAAYTEYEAAVQAEGAVFAIYSANGDTITPGTATGSQTLADLATYISSEETLLGTLENLAATQPGASAWAGQEIAWLQYTITAELQLLYSKGGTISGQTEASAVSAVQGSSTSPAIYPVVPGSSTSPVVGSASSGDQAMESLALQEEAAGNSAAAAATLSLLATSSNPVVASIASAELWLDLHGLWTQDAAGISAAASYIDGNYLANMGLFVAELSSATGATVSFNPVTGISYSSTTAAGSISASDIATESLALQEAAAGSFGAAAATLSILALSSNAAVAAIASAEIYLDTQAHWTQDWVGISAAASYIYGNSAASLSTMAGELSSATGSPIVWNGTAFVVSSTTPAGSISASDIATESLALQEAAAGSFTAAAATLSILAMSSNAVVASIASAEIYLDTQADWTKDWAGISAAASYIYGNSAAAMSTFVAELSSATGLTVSFSPVTGISYSSTTPVGSVAPSDMATESLALQEAAAGSYAAAAATLSILAASSNPAVASIASAEMIILKGGQWTADIAGMSIAASFIDGNATAAMSTVAAELGSVVGSTMVWTGTAFVVSSAAPAAVNATQIPITDAAAVALLSTTSWGNAAASALAMATLSVMVARDGSNTVGGADAEAAIEALAAGVPGSQAVAELVTDYNANLSSSETVSGMSAQDRSNENLVYEEGQIGTWSAMVAPLQALEGSSNLVVASIASAEMAILHKGDWSSDADGISEAASYISGNTSEDLRTLIAETASATGVTNVKEKTETKTSDDNGNIVTVSITNRTATISEDGTIKSIKLPDGCNISAKTLARRMAEGYSFQEACMMDLDSGSV